jgi:hypothetical protein
MFFVLVAPHIFCRFFKTKMSDICHKTPELWSVTYIHTDRQSDMVFIFLRMRLLASPFGLAINFFKGKKPSLIRRIILTFCYHYSATHKDNVILHALEPIFLEKA